MSGAATLLRTSRRAGSSVVNDVHSGLNPTRVAATIRVDSERTIARAIDAATRRGAPICIAGGRHAMGGQQFATDGVLLDMRSFDKVRSFDAERGIIEVESGIQWPALIRWLNERQQATAPAWAIAQKQTGADRLTIGGALSANIHGRGLRMKPFVADVESFTLIDADGQHRVCSRAENPELFRLAIGGYGLFGVIAVVQLRLVPRRKLRREVCILTVDDVMPAFAARIEDGCLYGDFQFATDAASDDFLRRGVFACYRPVADDTPMGGDGVALSEKQWQELAWLAHTDKRRAFDAYAAHYLATHGQLYWSDTHQLSPYLDDYHGALDARLGCGRGSEVITELYVPRERLADFLAAAADDFRRHRVDLIYGTVRLIEADNETVLAWARRPWACVVFNLHTEHTAAGQLHAAAAFRRLNTMAVARGGSFYLTYHRHATRAQLTRCYPHLDEFLDAKLRHDPQERFRSDWYTRMKQIASAPRMAQPAV
jgi:FAD/FMN-containing dehydrogenase